MKQTVRKAAAVLLAGVLMYGAAFPVSAESDIYTDEATLYFLDTKYKTNLTIPDDYPQTYQIDNPVKACKYD